MVGLKGNLLQFMQFPTETFFLFHVTVTNQIIYVVGKKFLHLHSSCNSFGCGFKTR
jgi:hypothetical protein